MRTFLAGALFVAGMLTLAVPLAPALGSPPSSPVAPTARFSWPLAPPHPVLRRFEAPTTPYGPGHRGVDLGAAPGEPVLAAADGVVVFAGHLVDRSLVSVDHPGGLRTTYEPITPAVTAGQPVHRGEVIGHLRPGHPECTGAAACLHWGVRRGEEYLDPLMLVSAHHVRLLPWKDP
jgi:murein DD-endopeptidase MepM/ murein hydrolase activator NlpD